MKKTNIITFVLAGGSGTRLAPLSLNLPNKLPKQFLSLVGKNTMLQETAARVPADSKIIIVPEAKYNSTIRTQLSADIDILAEPFGCNTAPAIGLSALYALHTTGDENAILFFVPADHIMDKPAFQKYFRLAVDAAQATDKIITIGITPERPETGYGYIKTSGQLKKGQDIYLVDSFKEKPALPTAQQYLATGGYFWNAGIFCMKLKTILSALQKDAPEMLQVLKSIDFKKDLQDEITKAYTKIKELKQNISIDYAVMEKEAANLLLLKAGPDLKWNDVGGWISLAKYVPPDQNNNLILNYLELTIELQNCHDLLIVTSENGILITSQALAQRAKEIIPGITARKKAELIECQDVSLDNDSNLYIGIIGLAKLSVILKDKKLFIKQ